MLPQVETLMTRPPSNVTDKHSIVDNILPRELEVLHRDLIVPHTALTNPLGSHKRLPDLGILRVVFAPFENREISLVRQVEWRLIGGVLVRLLLQELRDGVVSRRHSKRVHRCQHRFLLNA